MKRFIFKMATACLTVGLFAGISTAQTPPLGTTATKGISGTSHDFGTASWNQSQQICLPCHIPHSATLKDANGQLLGGPLWNHTLSKTATYTLFQSWTTAANPANIVNGVTQSNTATVNVQTGNVDQNTKLCLSCHDGTVAMDSFISVPHNLAGTMKAGTGTTFIMSWADKTAGTGTDLSTNHPLGDAARWTYPTPSYMVDPSLRDAKGMMPLRPMADGGLAVGCTSCHEPHNRNGNADFLWVNNSGPGTTVDGRSVTGSTLCMNCHIK